MANNLTSTATEFEVHGVPQAIRALEGFKPSKQKTILRKATRAYTSVMVKGLRRRAKQFKRTGALSRAMGVVIRTRKDGSVHGRAGALRGKRFVLHTTDSGKKGIGRAAAKKSSKPGKKRIQPSRYSHLAERKHHFHEETQSAHKTAALAAFQVKLKESVELEARKQLAKAAG